MATASHTVSLTARLTLGFVALLVAAHVAICFYLDYALQQEFSSEDRRDLAGQAAFLRHVLAQRSAFRDLQGDPQLLEAKILHARLHFALRDPQGRTVESSYDARWLANFSTSDAAAGARTADPVRTVAPDGRVWRVFVSHAALGDAAKTPIALALALDVTEREDFAERYRSRLVIAALVTAVAAGVVGLPLVRGALTPLGAMARRAGEISAARLDERLPVDRVPQELQALSVAFNHTLERLQDSFRRLSQFSSDLAHELRTPIGNLMGEAQVALRRARSPEEYQAVLASAVEEYERINRMIDGMLFLARADNARAALRPARLDAGREVSHVAEYYEGLLAERGVGLHIRGEATVWADPELLRRAVSNLVSNAVAHTPAGGEIAVRLSGEASGVARIEVSNPGAGIAPEALPRVFDRFFRADAARGGPERGSGLGLAIVRSIMQLHGGSATVISVPGELTTFVLRFPPYAGPGDAGGRPPDAASGSESLAGARS